MKFFTNIIAVKGNIQFAILNHHFGKFFFNFCYYTIRKINTSRLKTYQYRVGKISIVFQYLVRQPFDSNSQLLFVEN